MCRSRRGFKQFRRTALSVNTLEGGSVALKDAFGETDRFFSIWIDDR